jgi:hypothetical protein
MCRLARLLLTTMQSFGLWRLDECAGPFIAVSRKRSTGGPSLSNRIKTVCSRAPPADPRRDTCGKTWPLPPQLLSQGEAICALCCVLSRSTVKVLRSMRHDRKIANSDITRERHSRLEASRCDDNTYRRACWRSRVLRLGLPTISSVEPANTSGRRASLLCSWLD